MKILTSDFYFIKRDFYLLNYKLRDKISRLLRVLVKVKLMSSGLG
jgi:hypothetical protein